MFFELMPMLKERTVLITVALIDGKLKVNVIPTKAKDSEDHALTTPLSYTGSPRIGCGTGQTSGQLRGFTRALGSTLAEAKAEMDAAAKAARQRAKATQQTPKTDQTTSKQDTPAATPTTTETTPSLFGPQQQTGEPPAQAGS